MTIDAILSPRPLTDDQHHALNEAVAAVLGLKHGRSHEDETRVFYATHDHFFNPDEEYFNAAGDWAIGGPLVGIAGLNFRKVDDNHFEAWYTGCPSFKGVTHLIAGMNCIAGDTERSRTIFKKAERKAPK